MEHIFTAVERFSMLSDGDSLILCVSGGSDSMAMLHFFSKNAQRLGVSRLYACHINHGLRPLESPAEQRGVEMLCKRLGVELFISQLNMSQRVKPLNFTAEQWARELRYGEFYALSKRLGAKLATAHTLTDNAETVLFNLARGAGLSGAGGIPPVRKSIIRPLILTDSDATERYCIENKIEFFTDSSNNTDDYTRNFIRHNITPPLRQVNSAADANLSRFALQARLAGDYINTQAAALLDSARTGGEGFYSARTLAGAHPALINAAVFSLISPYTKLSAQVERCVRALQGGEVQLCAGVRFHVSQGLVRVLKDELNASSSYSLECVVGKNELPFGRAVTVYVFSEQDINKNKINFNYHLKNTADYDRIIGKLLFRTRRTGETYTSASRKVTKTLKKLYGEMRIPAENRWGYPALFDDSGCVWVAGQGVSADRAADSNTKKYIYFEVG